ncbi:dihydrodipicolinate synthase family protein [Actinoallomurus acaciae]|uniref:Dihydrodipicolinate synthase family protein n=1 Tax=Actinoallomurus acaciae TaxID=502577 RepID=A0ABV5YUJ2_9ACTN
MITRENRVLRRPGRRFLLLPASGGALESYELKGPYAWPRAEGRPTSRIAYAAAHVVADPLAEPASAKLDWDATLAYRRHLWSWGLRVADAMDTAQRNAGLDWDTTRELVRRSAAEAKAFGDPYDLLACGAGTDHAPEADSPAAVANAYEEQIAVVEQTGARVILMASRQLAAIARVPEDYHEVYGRLLRQASRPVILHWLGEMFDPKLAGYWGSGDTEAATSSFLDLVNAHAPAIDGVKVSLLDPERETRLREALPAGVRLYTGDDLDYPSLIKDGSDALLGVFDAIAPAASAALAALDRGETGDYDEILNRTLPLARKIFEPPTYHYKTGLVFLAWLAGHQNAFVMVGGAQSARSVLHLTDVFRLADQAGLLPDPDLAMRRMRSFLTTAGVL